MPRTVEFEDPNGIKLVKELKQAAKKEDAGIWKRLAGELDRGRQNRRNVNIWRINKHTTDGETIVVPGKILGSGNLSHKLNIAAFKFTEGARHKIEKSGSKILSMSELIKKNPHGSNVRIIG